MRRPLAGKDDQVVRRRLGGEQDLPGLFDQADLGI